MVVRHGIARYALRGIPAPSGVSTSDRLETVSDGADLRALTMPMGFATVVAGG